MLTQSIDCNHFVLEQVSQWQLPIRFIATNDQLVDAVTRGLSTARFVSLHSKFNIRDLPLRFGGVVDRL